MHFVHFANVIGCNNMLMLKVCKSFCKLLEHLFYFTCARGISVQFWRWTSVSLLSLWQLADGTFL